MSAATAPARKWAALADSAFYLAAAIVGRGAHLLAVPLLVRILPPAQFALFDIALVLITLTATALLLGTDSGAAAEYARHPVDDATALRGIFLVSLQIPLLLAVAGGAVVAVLQVSGLLGSIGAVVPWLILFASLAVAIGNCAVGLLRWTARARSAAFLMGLNGFVPMGVVLAMAFATPAPNEWLLAGFLAGQAVTACVSVGCAWQALGGFGPTTRKVRTQTLMARSWTLGAASLAAPARRAAERLLVLGLFGETAAAGYAVLARSAQVMEITLQALGNGFYPRALRSLDQIEGRRLAVLALRLFFGTTLVALLAGWVGAGPLLVLMGGGVQAPRQLLPVMLAVGAFSALPFCAGMAYMHTGKLAQYASMLLLAGGLSLLAALSATLLMPGMEAWMMGLLGGHMVAALALLRQSERLHAAGYTWPLIATGVAGMGVLSVAPLLGAGWQ